MKRVLTILLLFSLTILFTACSDADSESNMVKYPDAFEGQDISDEVANEIEKMVSSDLTDYIGTNYKLAFHSGWLEPMYTPIVALDFSDYSYTVSSVLLDSLLSGNFEYEDDTLTLVPDASYPDSKMVFEVNGNILYYLENESGSAAREGIYISIESSEMNIKEADRMPFIIDTESSYILTYGDPES